MTARSLGVSPETALRVFNHMRTTYGRGSFITVGLLTLADDLGVGLTTAERAIKFLTTYECIEIVRKGTGDGYPTTYRVPVVGGD